MGNMERSKMAALKNCQELCAETHALKTTLVFVVLPPVLLALYSLVF